MSGYRDELTAARSRIDSLESELIEQRAVFDTQRRHNEALTSEVTRLRHKLRWGRLPVPLSLRWWLPTSFLAVLFLSLPYLGRLLPLHEIGPRHYHHYHSEQVPDQRAHEEEQQLRRHGGLKTSEWHRQREQLRLLGGRAVGLPQSPETTSPEEPSGVPSSTLLGQLAVQSAEPVAIYIDQQFVGLSPIDLPLAAGRHTLSVTRNDHQLHRSIAIDPGRRMVFSVAGFDDGAPSVSEIEGDELDPLHDHDKDVQFRLLVKLLEGSADEEELRRLRALCLRNDNHICLAKVSVALAQKREAP